jgi:hypothetical protein
MINLQSWPIKALVALKIIGLLISDGTLHYIDRIIQIKPHPIISGILKLG